ncbi:MAG: hypothetical protein KY468_15690, partial [Armatimonadetes bacterium]|nr:hypothetical protein [Armatimonadota bacterium]
MAQTTLSQETVTVQDLIRSADSFSAQRGRSYFHQGRARLESLDKTEALYAVQGSRPTPYQVRLQLQEDGSLAVTCDCPFARGVPKVICKHKIASALALQDHFRMHPVLSWEDVLG